MTCLYCSEPITSDEPVQDIRNGSLHKECYIRMVLGSAAHQLRECACYGGEREDPPNVSPRDAARLAYDTFKTLNI